MTTLAQVRRRGDKALYPTEALNGCEDALVLFAAGFLGEQDCVWIEQAGIRATCVDTDADLVAEMRRLYPASWRFVVADAYYYASETPRQWDLVSVDCPSGTAMERCAALAPLWCKLARRAVVLGTAPGSVLVAPGGWAVSRTVSRSPIADWTLLEAV